MARCEEAARPLEAPVRRSQHRRSEGQLASPLDAALRRVHEVIDVQLSFLIEGAHHAHHGQGRVCGMDASRRPNRGLDEEGLESELLDGRRLPSGGRRAQLEQWRELRNGRTGTAGPPRDEGRRDRHPALQRRASIPSAR